MRDIDIRYRFTLVDGTEERFDLALDPESLAFRHDPPADLPRWTELRFGQCPNCPLDSASSPRCPPAVRLVGVVEGFARVLSYERVRVEVATAERTVTQEMSAQEAVGSLMGLIMAVSGCPHTAFFRPMARFHLPWATQEETLYRAATMYLLAQYFLRKAGGEGDLDLDGLAEIYGRVREVNQAFVDRLRAAGQEDSAINAIVVLDTHALALPWAIGESLDGLRHLFAPFLDRHPPRDAPASSG